MSVVEPNLAVEMANMVRDKWMHIHRGAWLFPTPNREYGFFFGNDGYAGDERSQRQVELLRQELPKHGFIPENFATSECGYSWVIFAKHSSSKEMDRQELKELLAVCWLRACGPLREGQTLMDAPFEAQLYSKIQTHVFFNDEVIVEEEDEEWEV